MKLKFKKGDKVFLKSGALQREAIFSHISSSQYADYNCIVLIGKDFEFPAFWHEISLIQNPNDILKDIL